MAYVLDMSYCVLYVLYTLIAMANYRLWVIKKNFERILKRRGSISQESILLSTKNRDLVLCKPRFEIFY